MRWDDLRYFLAVARGGQYERASRLLSVDATTIARHIRRLERDIGARLFTRGPEGQALTPAGEAIRERAEQIERLVDTVPTTVAGSDAGVTGTVRVSVSEGFGTAFIGPRLGDFQSRHPGLEIDLVASSGFLSPSRRETDIAILLARPRKGPLITRKLADYRLGLYASRGYLEEHDAPDSAGALIHHRLIGYVPDLLYTPELDYLAEVAPGLSPAIRSTSILAQFELVRAGAGIAVLPAFLAERSDRLVRVVPDVAIQRTFWLVVPRDMVHASRIRAFLDWLTALTQAETAVLQGRDAPQ